MVTEETLESMSVAQLRRYARDAGYSSITRLTTKDSLIPAILTQQQKDENSKPPEPADPSLAKAKASKEKLEALGWTCKGRAWVHRGQSNLEAGPLTIGTRTWTNMDVMVVEVTATRGEELLFMAWVDGECIAQQYSLFKAPEAKRDPAMPARKLTFDPDTITDPELIRILQGSKVTWWNKLAGSEETAVVAPQNGGVLVVEHYYLTDGREVQDARIIKFIDHHGGGFRAFRLSALLKVG